MRFILSAACAAGLLFNLGAGAAPKVTGDCDKLETSMRLSDQAGQKATCTATAVSSTGQRVTKTFTAYVKKVPQVGNQGEGTASVVVAENCTECHPTPQMFGLNEFGKIRDMITDSVASSADGVDEDVAVAAELQDGIESCTLDQAGRPTNLRGAQMLKCRIDQLNGKDADAAVDYYRRKLQPELQRLVRAHSPADRALGKQALQVINGGAGQQNLAIHESLKDMGHYLTYRDMVEAMGQSIEAAGPNPQLRTAEVQRLGMLQRQWTRTYQQRRDQLKEQGVLDADLETNSKFMESTLNQMYGMYGNEIKQAQGAAAGGSGRTMFGQPQAATTPAKPAAVPGRAPTPAAAPGGSFNQRILRSQ